MRKLTFAICSLLLLAVWANPASAAYQGEVGTVVRELEFRQLSGTSVKLSELVNHSDSRPLTLLLVWATWCPFCGHEMQDLSVPANLKVLHDMGIEVVAVSVDTDLETVPKYLEGLETPLQVALDPTGTLSKALLMRAVPGNILLDANRRILMRCLGYQNFGTLVDMLAEAKNAAPGHTRLLRLAE